MENQEFKGYELLLQDSPIVTSKKPLPVQALNNNTFANLLAELETIKRKFTRPLKVVIMGEVKAGKSTLLNALLNAEIAPTDVTETTATVMVITYGLREKGTIHFGNGETLSSSVDELYQELHAHKDDRNYFSHVSHVTVELPNDNLIAYHIVDTPGLGTVTDANEQVTLNYIQEADVVLWVLNVHHIGQADIYDYIEKVAEYGKPILAVLNRADEIDENVESLEEYVYDTLDMHVQKVMGMSGLQAYKARQAGDEALLQSSGFKKLQGEFDRLQVNAETVLDESIYSSLESFTEKYKYLHKATLNRLNFMNENTVKRGEEVYDFHKQLMLQISHELHSWTRHHLLEGNKQILLSQAKNMGLMNGSAEFKKIMTNLEKAISPEQIEEQLKHKLGEVSELFESKWNRFIDDFTRQLAEDQLAFEQTQLKDFEQTFVGQGTQFGHVMAKDFGEQLVPAAFQGAAVGTVSGAALATYAAIIGPAASTVTIGAAFAAFIPPLAILGGAIAGGMMLFNSNKKKRDALNQVEDSIQSIRNSIDDTVIPNIIDGFESRSKDVVRSIQSQLHNHQFTNWTESEIRQFIQQLDIYNTRLEMAHLDLKRVGV